MSVNSIIPKFGSERFGLLEALATIKNEVALTARMLITRQGLAVDTPVIKATTARARFPKDGTAEKPMCKATPTKSITPVR